MQSKYLRTMQKIHRENVKILNILIVMLNVVNVYNLRNIWKTNNQQIISDNAY